MDFDERGGWAATLTTLSRREHLSADHAAVAMGEVLAGRATSAQIAGFAVALRMKGETAEELTGLLAALLDAATPVVLPAEVADAAVDTCGTGGDQRHSINVSTMAAFVVAGAGVPVCKHGNRAMSSLAGSADVLEELGVAIDLGPDGVARCVGQVGMGFCLAPLYHPALRHAGPTRRELGIPTAFNVLGPMANPARVRRQVLGVADPAMAERMLQVLAARGSVRSYVVHGDDGLDELSTTGRSTMWHLGDDGRAVATVVDPEALGLARATLDDLRGGDVVENAKVVRQVLGGQTGPHRDVVVLNAAAGLMAGGLVGDLASGVARAAAVLDDGSAAAVLDDLVDLSTELARQQPAS